MLLFLNRGRGASDDRFLLAKVRIFSIGAVLALGGMFLDEDWLIWGALGVLGVGLLLRIIESLGSKPAHEDEAAGNGGPNGEP